MLGFIQEVIGQGTSEKKTLDYLKETLKLIFTNC